MRHADIQPTTPADAEAIARVINRAYEVEKFFMRGDRTDAETVRQMMTKGPFLCGRDEAGEIAAVVYLELRGARAYFGMLSVDPSAQGQGLGRRLVDHVEARARQEGCTTVDIVVVNLRTELFPFYERLGYHETATKPASDPRAIQPFHFVVMSKEL